MMKTDAWIPGKNRQDRKYDRLTPCSFYPPGVGPNGEKLCAWCGKPTANKRRKYCSKECADETGLRAGFLSGTIIKRDNFICQICGLDIKGLNKLLNEARMLEKQKAGVGGQILWHPTAYRNLGLKAFEAIERIDHILPVVEGGGSCGADNLRTLCPWCHKTVTAQLAKRLADEKRKTKTTGEGYLPLD